MNENEARPEAQQSIETTQEPQKRTRKPRVKPVIPPVELVDSFFTSLDNARPFFKCAFEGFAGSGKTFTAVEIAIGLHKRIGSTKPIAYFDTERAGQHLRQKFAKAGIAVLYKESRTLADLREVLHRGRRGAFDILVVDSISHVWETFLRDYQRETERKRLQFEDWGVLKPRWREEFSDPFVQDPYHAIMCGRAGYEYEDEKVEDPNRPGKTRREIYKVGVKMKVEGETAYEPNMLVMMERFEEVLEKDKKVWREATILKDRSTLLDGRTFRNPTYKDFAPAIDFLLEDVVQKDEPTETPNLFETDEHRREFGRRRDIALETIENDMVKAGLAGQAVEAKKGKVAALEHAFGTASWTAIKSMHPQELEDGILVLRKFIASRSTSDAEVPTTPLRSNGKAKGAIVDTVTRTCPVTDTDGTTRTASAEIPV